MCQCIFLHVTWQCSTQYNMQTHWLCTADMLALRTSKHETTTERLERRGCHKMLNEQITEERLVNIVLMTTRSLLIFPTLSYVSCLTQVETHCHRVSLKLHIVIKCIHERLQWALQNPTVASSHVSATAYGTFLWSTWLLQMPTDLVYSQRWPYNSWRVHWKWMIKWILNAYSPYGYVYPRWWRMWVICNCET